MMRHAAAKRCGWGGMWVLVALGGAACTRTQPQAPAGEAAAPAVPAKTEVASADAMTEARGIFAQRCVMCHGLAGKGDGVAAASLSPKPQDYTQAAWQKATGDDEIRKVILGGGPAVGKSMMMPANPDLQDKPQVVDGLVSIVRSLGQT